MSNKKIFKKLYLEKMNKDNNYQEILKRIDNSNNEIAILKKVLIPVCSLVVVFSLMLININQKSSSFESIDQIYDSDQGYDIYINNYSNNNYTNTNLNSVTSSNSNKDMSDSVLVKKKDADYETIIKVSKFSFLTDLNIPTDLRSEEYSEVYVKENEDSGYNNLQNYEFVYTNSKRDREIKIYFTDKYITVDSYMNDNNIKKTIINNTEVIIFQNINLYNVMFVYNDIYFNIETNNIEEEELINLLISIIE